MSNMCKPCNLDTCKIEARKRCSRCKLVHYCSKECQKQDWTIHKHECIERRPIDDIWERCKWKTPQNAKQKNTCVLCPNMNVIEKLNNELEIREYQISGMCTICQNKLFVNEDNKTPS